LGGSKTEYGWTQTAWWLAWRSLHSDNYRRDDLERFEDSLDGVWLQADIHGGLILVLCDDVYFRKFALGFLRSMHMVSEAHSVHFHLLKNSSKNS